MSAARVEAIRRGERRAIARAISAIEEGGEDGEALAGALAPDGRAHVVGITGPPGAGKSTLVDGLLAVWLARGRRVGVLAVDPSSPHTGGAVLGDRVRMPLGADERVFIRSFSARGRLGGVSSATRRAIDVLDVAGFDVIVVETVGAGQSDVEVASLADCVVVVCPPGLGDEVQAIKAGILEIADVLAVSKSDLPLADRTVRDLLDMTSLGTRHRPPPAVVRTAASIGEGCAALADAIAAHRRMQPHTRRHGASARPGTRAAWVGVAEVTPDRGPPRFLPTPLARGVVEEVLAIAATAGGTNVSPGRVHVLAGNVRDALCAAACAAFDAVEPGLQRRDSRRASIDPDRERPCRSGASPGAPTGAALAEHAPRAVDRGDFRFRDAPVGLIFTADCRHASGSAADRALFMAHVTLVARARGLEACALAAWSELSPVVARVLDLSPDEQVFCGMALGHADPGAGEQPQALERERVAAFAAFRGFDP